MVVHETPTPSIPCGNDFLAKIAFIDFHEIQAVLVKKYIENMVAEYIRTMKEMIKYKSKMADKAPGIFYFSQHCI